jgi:hypothetical protein
MWSFHGELYNLMKRPLPDVHEVKHSVLESLTESNRHHFCSLARHISSIMKAVSFAIAAVAALATALPQTQNPVEKNQPIAKSLADRLRGGD